jgi:hypothetical protein
MKGEIHRRNLRSGHYQAARAFFPAEERERTGGQPNEMNPKGGAS